MIKRSIIRTSDGSKTIQIKDWDEQYHSIHGALQEAKHVYLEAGFKTYLNRIPNLKNLNILEIGFGTGLNAYLTAFESIKHPIKTYYHAIEAYPLKKQELKELEYDKLSDLDPLIFHKIHDCSWGKMNQISPEFSIIKRQEFFSDINDINFFDIVYFDAFGPRVQPELWGVEIFLKMYNALKLNGVLVTYSAKGSVRRTMQNIGFKVERINGPVGKREMLRSTK